MPSSQEVGDFALKRPLQVQHVGMVSRLFPVSRSANWLLDKLRIIRYELAQVLDRHFGIAKFSQHRGR